MNAFWSSLRRLFLIGLAYVGAGLSLAASGILLSQVYEWLRFGDWQPSSLDNLLKTIGWPHPHVSWVGVQKIIDAGLEVHPTVLLLPLGVLVFGFAGQCMKETPPTIAAQPPPNGPARGTGQLNDQFLRDLENQLGNAHHDLNSESEL